MNDEDRGLVEAEVECRQARERANEQPRRDDQHERQRHLGDDERIAEGMRAFAGHRPRLLLERVGRFGPPPAQGRPHPEQQCRERGDGRRERHRPPVQRQVQRHVVARRRQLVHQQLAAPLREQQSARGADAGEQQALGEQLPGNPESRGADRQPDAQLVPARRRARQQQVGDVGAGDQQDEDDDAHDDEQRPLVAVAQFGRARGRRRQREALAQVLFLSLRPASPAASFRFGSAGCACRSAAVASSAVCPGLRRAKISRNHVERASSQWPFPISSGEVPSGTATS